MLRLGLDEQAADPRSLEYAGENNCMLGHVKGKLTRERERERESNKKNWAQKTSTPAHPFNLTPAPRPQRIEASAALCVWTRAAPSGGEAATHARRFRGGESVFCSLKGTFQAEEWLTLSRWTIDLVLWFEVCDARRACWVHAEGA